MIELSICVDYISNSILCKYEHFLHNVIRNAGGIFSRVEIGKSTYFLIASNKNEDKIMDNIKECICAIINDEFKTAFIKKSLTYHTTNSMHYNALVYALASFDKISDDKYILYKLKLIKDFNIYSFYNFSLRELQNKWLQLINLTNQNQSYLNFNQTYFDILKFLIDGIENGEELNIKKRSGKIYVQDKNNNILKVEQFSNDCVLEQVIKLNPIKLNVSGLGKELQEFLMELYEDRLNIF